MDSLLVKLKEWSSDDTVRGLAPWLLLILLMIAFNQRYDYVRTDLVKTVDGFEPRKLYLQQVGSGFCVGDMVQFRSVERSSKYFKKVMADSGAILTLTDNGYRIDETDYPMSAEWLAKAREEMGERTSITVPANQVLFVNPEFATDKKYDFWAFETVPRENVRDWVSHVLFSRDFSRIGEKVGTADATCIR